MPFGGYEDFADCVSQNSDKDDPSAYCGTIKHATEGKAEDFNVGDTVTSFGDLKVVFAGKTDKGKNRFALIFGPQDEPKPEAKSSFQFLGELATKGGTGSGNFGHEGRPGEVGGSQPNPFRTERASLSPLRRELGVVHEITRELIEEPDKVTARKIAARKLNIPLNDKPYHDWTRGQLLPLEQVALHLVDADPSEFIHGKVGSLIPGFTEPSTLKQVYMDSELSKSLVPDSGLPVFRGIRPPGDYFFIGPETMGKLAPTSVDTQKVQNWDRLVKWLRDEPDADDEFLLHNRVLESFTENKATADRFGGVTSFEAEPFVSGLSFRRVLEPDDVFLHHAVAPIGLRVSEEGVDDLDEKEVIVLNRAPWTPVLRKDMTIAPRFAMRPRR